VNLETNNSFFRFHQLGGLARFFDRLDGEFDLDAFAFDLLWRGFFLGQTRNAAISSDREKSLSFIMFTSNE
jgi:hypothetical protein